MQNDDDGKYRKEARYGICPHIKSFCGVQGILCAFLQKEPLAAGDK
jgi:hypothetical protein